MPQTVGVQERSAGRFVHLAQYGAPRHVVRAHVHAVGGSKVKHQLLPPASPNNRRPIPANMRSEEESVVPRIEEPVDPETAPDV